MVQGQPVDVRRVAAALGEPLGGAGRNDGGGQDLGRQAPRGPARPAVRRRRRGDRGGRATHHSRDFRAVRRALFPRGRAPGDRAAPQRRPAGARDRRRRLHECDDPRGDRRAAASRSGSSPTSRFCSPGCARSRTARSCRPTTRRRRCAGSWPTAPRPTRSPTSPSNRAMGRTTRLVDMTLRRLAELLCGPPGAERRRPAPGRGPARPARLHDPHRPRRDRRGRAGNRRRSRPAPNARS